VLVHVCHPNLKLHFTAIRNVATSHRHLDIARFADLYTLEKVVIRRKNAKKTSVLQNQNAMQPCHATQLVIPQSQRKQQLDQTKARN